MTNSPDLRPILEELAAGRIDAAEAARRIDALKTQAAASPQPDAASRPAESKPTEPSNEDLFGEPRRQYSPHSREEFTQPSFGPAEESAQEVPPSPRRPSGSKGVDRISVRAVGRRVRIVGDSSVATAAAEGPHVLRRNGSVLEVTSDGDIGPSLDGFTLLKPPRNLDELRAMSLGKELYLRVNPTIIVDVEVTAGSLNTDKVPYLGKVRVTAGGAVLERVAEINDALVQAGSATIKGRITAGRSRVRVESGSLIVALEHDSNVTVRGEAQLGKIAWTGAHTGAADEVVLGNGSARLDVAVVMGYAQVKAGEVNQ